MARKPFFVLAALALSLVISAAAYAACTGPGPYNPLQRGYVYNAFSTADDSTTVVVSGNFAYVAEFLGDTIYVVDISDPDNPVERGSVKDQTKMRWISEIAVSGNFLYAVGWANDSLTVVDVSDPDAPVARGRIANGTTMNGPRGVAVSGNFAYVSSELSDSLTVIDISDPDNPVERGSVSNASTLNRAWNVAVAGNFAYVAANEYDGLTIIDISDPDSPTERGNVQNATTMDGAYDVAVSGSFAYLTATTSDSLVVIDITDPDSPTERGNVTNATTMNAIRRIAVSGSFAYVASELSDSLVIIDISDPDSPTERGNVTNALTMDEAWGIAVSGNFAYTISFEEGALTVVDITNPDAPVERGILHNQPVLVNPAGVALSGNFAYVAASWQGANALTVVDIANPDAPQIRGSVNNATTLGEAQNVAVSGNFAYVVAPPSDALTVVDISDPDSPVERGSVSNATTMDVPWSVAVSGNFAYVAALSSGRLVVIDITDPDNPTERGNIALSGATGVAVSGNFAYVVSSNYDGLKIVDISDPDNPAARGSVANASTMDTAVSVALSGNFAYIATGSAVGDASLVIIDITDPDNPTERGNTAATDTVRADDIAVAGTYAYLASYAGNGPTVIDITDPDDPVKVGSLNNPTSMDGTSGIAVSGDFVYVTGKNSNAFAVVQVLDDSSPTPVPVTLGPCTTAGTRDWDAGNSAYKFCNGTDWVKEGCVCQSDWASATQNPTFNHPTPGTADNLGRTVSVSGNKVVVGAAQDNVAFNNDGIVFVFDATDGSVISTINNPSPTDEDRFGEAVAISGNLVVVGVEDEDPGGTTDAGTAYVFNATTGALLWTLNNPAPAVDDHFGDAVAIDGNIVVVGAGDDDPGGTTDAGTAYVFDATDGSLMWTLNKATPAAGDLFGEGVAVSGNVIVIGASGDASGGKGYVFDATTGLQTATLSNPTGSGDMGHSVGVSGNIAVLGDHKNDPGGTTDAGAAFVFNTVTGSNTATLNNPEADVDDWFGWRVAISGTTALVGARQDDVGATSDAGEAYLFDATDGTLLATLANPDPTVDDDFGYGVGISGNIAVVTANGDDMGGATSNAGTAYVFAPASDCGAGCLTLGACTTQATFEYDQTEALYKYCDGTDWIAVTNNAAAGSCAGTTLAAREYDAAAKIMKWCDGTDWIDMSATTPAAKCVFTTSTTFKGNTFGGVAGADAECNSRAAAAGLGGNSYKAWISDSAASANSRLTHSTGIYELVDGTKVADDWTDLTDGTIDNPINIDETNTASAATRVWTGTTETGATATDHCSDWTSGAGGAGTTATGGAEGGLLSATNASWSADLNNKCGSTLPLHCFEQ